MYTAHKKITIVSPFISDNALKSGRLLMDIENVIYSGVIVEVITDHKLDRNFDGSLKPRSQRGRALLREMGVHLKEAYKVHSKIIIVDDTVLIIGSFNWLSAVRNPSSLYANQETSTCLVGPSVKGKILKVEKTLSGLTLFDEKDRLFFKTLQTAIKGNVGAYIALCKKYRSSDLKRYKNLISQSISYFMGDVEQISQITRELRRIGVDILPGVIEHYNGDFSCVEDLIVFAEYFHEISHREIDKFVKENIESFVFAGENIIDLLENLSDLKLLSAHQMAADLSNGVYNGVVFDRMKR